MLGRLSSESIGLWIPKDRVNSSLRRVNCDLRQNVDHFSSVATSRSLIEVVEQAGCEKPFIHCHAPKLVCG
jgi:hypothetical protein